MRNEGKCKSFISTRYTLHPNAPGSTLIYLTIDSFHLFSHLYYFIICVVSGPGFIWRWGGIGSGEPFSHRVRDHRENISKLFEHASNRLKIFSHRDCDADEKKDGHRRSAQSFNETRGRWVGVVAPNHFISRRENVPLSKVGKHSPEIRRDGANENRLACKEVKLAAPRYSLFKG